MPSRTVPILIMENDAPFCDHLKEICAGIGKPWVAGKAEDALGFLIQQPFQLLLLNWNLIQSDPSAFDTAINNFQFGANRMALFKFPQLIPVIAAMKSGMSDVLWPGQDSEVLEEKIRDSLYQTKPAPITHSFVSQLADSVTDKAIEKKISFFKARKEFSKTFLYQIIGRRKMRRSQLAGLMGVSTRTLHRHLSA
jgi:hypothetical protein